MNSLLSSKWLKVVVFLLCLVPIGNLARRGFQNGLSADPATFVEHTLGDWTIRFLIITLAITPFRKLLGWPALIRYRRMTGLYAFFYGCLHLTTYLWLDRFFDLHEIWKDVSRRPFITAGFTAFVLMIPLALTSTAGWIRRLGGKRWQLLHRAIYVSAIAGVVHYYWLVKSDVRKPLQYAAMVTVLLVWRLAEWMDGRRRRRAAIGLPEEELTTAESA